MFVSHRTPAGQNNKSYDYENNNKYMQKRKIQQKSARRKCRSHLNHKHFSDNFICDPLHAFYNPIGAINIKIMRQDFKMNQKHRKKNNFFLEF